MPVVMALYPSEEWLSEYCWAVSESEELDDFGFSENILFAVTDLRLSALTIGDLNDDALEDIPDDILVELADMTLAEALSAVGEEIKSSLSEPVKKLLDQAERHVTEGTIYVHIELDDGKCNGMELIEDPGDVEYDAEFRASADTWQSIVAGRPAIATVMSGELEVIGNELLLMKYLGELQLLCDIASRDVETEFLFNSPDTPFVQFVFDESLRYPLAFQKEITREAALAARTFTPFWSSRR